MDLSPLLKPQSVAIVGIFDDLSGIGGRMFRALLHHGYAGKVFLVNPEYEEVEGIKCYPSLLDVPSEIDAVLIAVPGEAVLGVIEEAGKKRVKSAIIYSSGFAEFGGEGISRQEQIAISAKKHSLLICGPNCAGIVNFHDNVAMSSSQFFDMPELTPGNIAVVSQSSSLGGALINQAQDRKIGISYFISTGNEAVLESSDYVEYLLDDSNTSVIVLLMEGIRDAEKFLRVADLALEKKKPIVAMKLGRTPIGKKAATFHTGSMTGSDAVYEAIFRQKGIIRVDEPDELYLTASMLAKSRLPKGNRIGIITSTGGGGVVLSDKVVEMGMVIPELAHKTVKELSEASFPFGIAKNPLDIAFPLLTDSLLFTKSLDLFAQDENLDAIIVVISMVGEDGSKEIASHIIRAAESAEKPIVTWWIGGNLSTQGMRMLGKSSVALFTSPDQCAKALAAALTYGGFLESHVDEKPVGISTLPSDRGRIESILESSGRIVTEDMGKGILSAYGIPIPSEKLSRSLDEGKKIAAAIGYPVALKIISPQIPHKTEAGGLKLGIKNEEELSFAYTQIFDNAKEYNPQAEIKGVLVQEMVESGKEVIVGMLRDSQFGPMILFGLGGVFVEVLKDFSLRHAPLKEKDAWSMIREIKGYPVLEGVRGGTSCDLGAIVRVLIGVSQLAVDFQKFISSMDINPLVVYPEGQGVKVLDCLFVKKNGR